MKKVRKLYEGKAKIVYETENQNCLIVEYKDEATAFNGAKKGKITGKGVINNRVTNHLMQILEKENISTHFIKEISEREAVVKNVKIIPLEVIIRNISAGSFSKRYGVKEGIIFDSPTIEFSYKNDNLGDPLINEYHALALNIASQDEIDRIKNMAFKINDILKSYFKRVEVDLVDFKLEFGKTLAGEIILADEISPDTCRFWDSKTHKKLDKDRFRQDLGNVEEAYAEMMSRIIKN
ncbi:MAG: phosphoribosylaminoimidazolesuccinocarboxamide synthase [Oscillospiraceae bacterium]|nr:phosphoribosylaminoimidazolesuccinocarboxamide synthase [Oscillospiraceae bacterium]